VTDEATRRIEALEMQMAHQDRAIEELSEVITRQYQEMEKLNRRLMRMEDEVRAVQEATPTPGREPPPPHY